MRELARFDTRDTAETVSAALTVDGIENQLMERDNAGADPVVSVWVVDETQLEQARSLLALFEREPNGPVFRGAKKEAQALARERERASKPPPVVNVRQRWQREGRTGPVTLTFLLLMLVVFVLTFPGAAEQLGASRDAIESWFLFDTNAEDGALIYGYFRDIRKGEVWRLVAPAFLHTEPTLQNPLSLLHFVFNFGAFLFLAPMVERRYGSMYLLVLALGLAVASNTAQYWVAGPDFCGMSGVIFGLFGFLWLRGRVDPSADQLPSNTVFTALLWLGFGFLGFMPIANWAHLGGIVVGGLVGLIAGTRNRRRS